MEGEHMPKIVFWIHPAIQWIATAMAGYTLWLAWPRFLYNHWGIKGRFQWNDHVKWGKYSHIFWMAGMVIGAAVVARNWGGSGATGDHYWIGQLIMPCIAAGYITGSIMDRDKKPRRYLPLIHGVCNLLALLIAIIQIFTGIKVIQEFLL
jgi:hypothetical protein